MLAKFLKFGLLFFSFLGLLDAAYLTIEHYKNATPPCSIAHGCEIVLTSQYATIWGIPISIPGILYYLTVMILVGILLQGVSRIPFGKITISIPVGTLILTSAGLLVGIYLVYLQAFVLHAFCQYCLGSEVIDLLLFLAAFFLWKSEKISSEPTH